MLHSACSTCRVGGAHAQKRTRETVGNLANPVYLMERATAGWRLRRWNGSATFPRGSTNRAPGRKSCPTGCQISVDGARLVENPSEIKIVILSLDRVVEDCPLSQVSAELNRHGYRMRNGQPWTPIALFTLLPRMI